MTIEKPAAGVALVLCAAILWGTTGTAQTFAPSALSSLWVGTLRLAVASAFFMLCVALIHPSGFKPASLLSLPFRLVLIAAIGMAGYNLAFFAGIRATSVASGTALALGSGPVWAGIIDTIHTRQKPPGGWWLGVGIAISGLLVVTAGTGEATSWSLHGIALCLLSGLCYAIYGLSTKRILVTAPPLLSVAAIFTLAALIALPVVGSVTELPQLQWADLSVLLWLGVMATGIAYLLFSYGLRYLTSSTGIALALAEPVAALLFAVAIVGERPQLEIYVGIGIILAGLALLIYSELRMDNAREPRH